MLRDAVMAAAARSEVRAAVARVYAELQAEIDRRKPRCDASGRCCRFEEFGHRLYVTTIELAAFVSQLAAISGNCHPEGSGSDPRDLGKRKPFDAEVPQVATAPFGMTIAAGGCPFQVGGLCSVHSIRPFGCRVFFCDPTSDEWQHAQYERFHAQLKRLHEEFDVPYRYVEWRQALGALGPLPLAASRIGDLPRREAASGNPATGNPARRLSLPQLPL
jgi:Fe-S-cluster containining protein